MGEKEIVNQLEELGFVLLTEWELRKDRIKPKRLDWDECSRWLYAFVSKGRIKYIGLTTTVLRTRLDGYSYSKDGINGEINRVGALIKNALLGKDRVKIFGARRQGSTTAQLDSEETHLINYLNADWNIAKKL